MLLAVGSRETIAAKNVIAGSKNRIGHVAQANAALINNKARFAKVWDFFGNGQLGMSLLTPTWLRVGRSARTVDSKPERVSLTRGSVEVVKSERTCDGE